MRSYTLDTDKKNLHFGQQYRSKGDIRLRLKILKFQWILHLVFANITTWNTVNLVIDYSKWQCLQIDLDLPNVNNVNI